MQSQFSISAVVPPASPIFATFSRMLEEPIDRRKIESICRFGDWFVDGRYDGLVDGFLLR